MNVYTFKSWIGCMFTLAKMGLDVGSLSIVMVHLGMDVC